jgi:two-component sensor histidine kinase
MTDLRNHHPEPERGHSAAEHHHSGTPGTSHEARNRVDGETRTVVRSAMRTLQGLAAEQQLMISRLQDKYSESTIFPDLLEIDHMNSQFGRRAQSIAVLCEGWPGRQREVASVYDVIRSAQGRIRHFQRVEILSQVDFAVTSRAVEPVALAVAELLDNATSYSNPETTVEINVRAVPKGICIVVDDAGVGMNDEERTKATGLLSGERASGVSGLGNPPQFGFAVIGVLCERYGFTVSVDSASPYGGVRAVVLLPGELLTSVPQEPPRAVASTPGPPLGGGPERAAVAPGTAAGLPKRRRRPVVATASAPPAGPTAPAAPQRSEEEAAARMSAFQSGTLAGRAALRDPVDRTGSTRQASSEGQEVS